MSIAEAYSPRIGDNQPPLADRLALDYESIAAQAESIAERANAVPAAITTDAQLADAGDIAKAARLLRVEADGHRAEEKAPHLEAGKAIDGFFGQFIERMRRIQLALEGRAQLYQSQKAAEARKKAEAEAARIRAEDEARAKAAAELARKAREEADRKAAAAAAELERGRQTSAAKKQAAADAAKQEAERIEAERHREAALAEDRARYAAAQGTGAAKEAQKVRGESGVLASTTTRWRGSIDDANDGWARLDLNELKPHFSRAAVETAIGAYVRVHRDTRPLAGVVIQPETKATFR